MNGSGSLVPFTTGPYGTPIYFQAHLSWASGYGVPSAYVNFYDGSNGASQANVDAKGNALSIANTQIASGMHSITAAYYGDNSFASSSNLNPINFSIGQVATSTTLASQQTAQSLLLTATVSSTGPGSPATGMVTFQSGGSVLNTAPLTFASMTGGTSTATATFDASQLPAGAYTVTASYSGDTNYTASKSVPLSLTLVADFSIANRGFTSQTVRAGQTASYVNDLAITPFFGYSSPVTLSCTVPATATMCSVNPPAVSLTAGPNIASIAVTTTVRGAGILPHPLEPRRLPLAPLMLLFSLASCALLLRIAHRWQPRLAVAFVLMFLVGFSLVGCGGGSGAFIPPAPPAAPPPPQTTGTPAGTYTITVTGTAGATTHTTTFTMIVQ